MFNQEIRWGGGDTNQIGLQHSEFLLQSGLPSSNLLVLIFKLLNQKKHCERILSYHFYYQPKFQTQKPNPTKVKVLFSDRRHEKNKKIVIHPL